jgi:hypothetical protein
MPSPKALRILLILSIVFLWVSLLSQLCHAFLLAPVRHPGNVLHPLQRTYPLHAGLVMAVTGLVALCATRLAYCVRRAHQRAGRDEQRCPRASGPAPLRLSARR